MAEQQDIAEIKTHVLYIREHLDVLNRRLDSHRQAIEEHRLDDLRRFEEINGRLNRLLGGLVLAAALIGPLLAIARPYLP